MSLELSLGSSGQTHDEVGLEASVSSQQQVLIRSPRARQVVARGGPSWRGPRSQSPQTPRVRRAPPSHVLGPPSYRAKHGQHRPAATTAITITADDTPLAQSSEASVLLQSSSVTDVEDSGERARTSTPSLKSFVSTTALAQSSAVAAGSAVKSPATGTPTTARLPSGNDDGRSPVAAALVVTSAASDMRSSTPASQSSVLPPSSLPVKAVAPRPRRAPVAAPAMRSLCSEHASDCGVSGVTSERARATELEEEEATRRRRAERGWVQRHLPYAPLDDEGDTDVHLPQRRRRGERRHGRHGSTSSGSSSTTSTTELDSATASRSSVSMRTTPRRHRRDSHRHDRITPAQLVDRLQELYEALPSWFASRAAGDVAAVVGPRSGESQPLVCITVVIPPSLPPTPSSTTRLGDALVVRMYVEAACVADVTIADVKTELEQRLWIPRERQVLRADDPRGIVLEDHLPLLFLPPGLSPLLFMDATAVSDATVAALTTTHRSRPSSGAGPNETARASFSFRLSRGAADEAASHDKGDGAHEQVARARALWMRAQGDGSTSSHSPVPHTRGSHVLEGHNTAKGKRGEPLHSPRPARHRLLRSPSREAAHLRTHTSDASAGVSSRHSQRHRPEAAGVTTADLYVGPARDSLSSSSCIASHHSSLSVRRSATCPRSSSPSSSSSVSQAVRDISSICATSKALLDRSLHRSSRMGLGDLHRESGALAESLVLPTPPVNPTARARTANGVAARRGHHHRRTPSTSSHGDTASVASNRLAQPSLPLPEHTWEVAGRESATSGVRTSSERHHRRRRRSSAQATRRATLDSHHGKSAHHHRHRTRRHSGPPRSQSPPETASGQTASAYVDRTWVRDGGVAVEALTNV